MFTSRPPSDATPIKCPASDKTHVLNCGGPPEHLVIPETSPFLYFKASPGIIRLGAMMYARFPLSRCNVKDLLHERGVQISHETVAVLASAPVEQISPVA